MFCAFCQGDSRAVPASVTTGAGLNYKEKYLYGTGSFLSIAGLVINHDASSLILEGSDE